MPDRQGSEELSVRIGRLRDAARAEASAEPASAREQLGLEDSAIQVATRLAGTHGAARRAVMKDVQVGRTVTAKGDVAKTRLTREEKTARVEAWAQGLTQEQRDQFVASDKFIALPDAAAEILSQVFASLEDRAYEESIGIEQVNYDVPTPEVDSLFEAGDDEVDEDEAAKDYALQQFEQADWETEAS